MATRREKINKALIDSLVPLPGEDVFVIDIEDDRFGYRLKPSGASHYFIRYWLLDGRSRKDRRFKIADGRAAPAEARKLAREKLAQVALGADPSAKRKDDRAALTVTELCDRYLAAARAGLVMTRFRKPKRASTISIDEGRVARHIVPLIGKKTTTKLTRGDVQRMADAIAAGETAGTFKTKARGKAVVAGGAGTAARVVELLGGIWTWATKRELAEGPNPARGVETQKGDAKDRVLSPAELSRLGATLRELESGRPAVVAALLLIALTGLRREEACGLRWSEVDAASSCLRLRGTKTGRSTRPIGRAALDLLATLPRFSEYVFPNRAGTGSADLKKAFADLFNAAGLSDARSHDLRRTFASVAADEGYSDATIGELLGHSRRGVTARHYIRRPDAALVAAASTVSARISSALFGHVADVVKFEGRRHDHGK